MKTQKTLQDQKLE